MPDIADLLKRASPAEATVTVCLDGAAAGRLADLEAELAGFADWQPASMGETHPAAHLAEAIEVARREAAAATVDFHFRGLGHTAFSALLAAHPPKPGHAGPEPYDPDTFLPALLVECCIAPTLSPGQAAQLLEQVNDGTAQALFQAALAVNQEPSPLPF